MKRTFKLVLAFTGVGLIWLNSSFEFSNSGKVSNYSNNDTVDGVCPTGSLVKSSSGINGYTGSPADGGATCINCHGGGSTIPQVTLTASPAFVNNTYVPGQSYTITYQVSGYSYFGSVISKSVITSSEIISLPITKISEPESPVKISLLPLPEL